MINFIQELNVGAGLVPARVEQNTRGQSAGGHITLCLDNNEKLHLMKLTSASYFLSDNDQL